MTNSGAELCLIPVTCAQLDCNARSFLVTSWIKALVIRDSTEAFNDSAVVTDDITLMLVENTTVNCVFFCALQF